MAAKQKGFIKRTDEYKPPPECIGCVRCKDAIEGALYIAISGKSLCHKCFFATEGSNWPTPTAKRREQKAGLRRRVPLRRPKP